MIALRALKRQRGQSLTEFALILPVLLVILIGIIDFGRAVYAYHVVANCAREGARFGAVSPGNTGGITARVLDTAVGLNAGDLTVGISSPAADTIQVDVSYAFHLITPLISNIIGGGTLVLHSASSMYTGY